MPPARKLLSLLFLLLMGTELTQVRASNAIFLPAPAPRSLQSQGAARSRRPCPRRAPRLGRTPGCPPAALGMEGGVPMTEPGSSSPGPQLWPSWAVGDPLPAEKFKGHRRGQWAVVIWGAEQDVQAPPFAEVELS